MGDTTSFRSLTVAEASNSRVLKEKEDLGKGHILKKKHERVPTIQKGNRLQYANGETYGNLSSGQSLVNNIDTEEPFVNKSPAQGAKISFDMDEVFKDEESCNSDSVDQNEHESDSEHFEGRRKNRRKHKPHVKDSSISTDEDDYGLQKLRDVYRKGRNAVERYNEEWALRVSRKRTVSLLTDNEYEHLKELRRIVEEELQKFQENIDPEIEIDPDYVYKQSVHEIDQELPKECQYEIKSETDSKIMTADTDAMDNHGYSASLSSVADKMTSVSSTSSDVFLDDQSVFTLHPLNNADVASSSFLHHSYTDQTFIHRDRNREKDSCSNTYQGISQQVFSSNEHCSNEHCSNEHCSNEHCRSSVTMHSKNSKVSSEEEKVCATRMSSDSAVHVKEESEAIEYLLTEVNDEPEAIECLLTEVKASAVTGTVPVGKSKRSPETSRAVTKKEKPSVSSQDESTVLQDVIIKDQEIANIIADRRKIRRRERAMIGTSKITDADEEPLESSVQCDEQLDQNLTENQAISSSTSRENNEHNKYTSNPDTIKDESELTALQKLEKDINGILNHHNGQLTSLPHSQTTLCQQRVLGASTFKNKMKVKYTGIQKYINQSPSKRRTLTPSMPDEHKTKKTQKTNVSFSTNAQNKTHVTNTVEKNIGQLTSKADFNTTSSFQQQTAIDQQNSVATSNTTKATVDESNVNTISSHDTTYSNDQNNTDGSEKTRKCSVNTEIRNRVEELLTNIDLCIADHANPVALTTTTSTIPENETNTQNTDLEKSLSHMLSTIDDFIEVECSKNEYLNNIDQDESSYINFSPYAIVKERKKVKQTETDQSVEVFDIDSYCIVDVNEAYACKDQRAIKNKVVPTRQTFRKENIEIISTPDTEEKRSEFHVDDLKTGDRYAYQDLKEIISSKAQAKCLHPSISEDTEPESEDEQNVHVKSIANYEHDNHVSSQFAMVEEKNGDASSLVISSPSATITDDSTNQQKGITNGLTANCGDVKTTEIASSFLTKQKAEDAKPSSAHDSINCDGTFQHQVELDISSQCLVEQFDNTKISGSRTHNADIKASIATKQNGSSATNCSRLEHYKYTSITNNLVTKDCLDFNNLEHVNISHPTDTSEKEGLTLSITKELSLTQFSNEVDLYYVNTEVLKNDKKDLNENNNIGETTAIKKSETEYIKEPELILKKASVDEHVIQDRNEDSVLKVNGSQQVIQTFSAESANEQSHNHNVLNANLRDSKTNCSNEEKLFSVTDNNQPRLLNQFSHESIITNVNRRKDGKVFQIIAVTDENQQNVDLCDFLNIHANQVFTLKEVTTGDQNMADTKLILAPIIQNEQDKRQSINIHANIYSSNDIDTDAKTESNSLVNGEVVAIMHDENENEGKNTELANEQKVRSKSCSSEINVVFPQAVSPQRRTISFVFQDEFQKNPKRYASNLDIPNNHTVATSEKHVSVISVDSDELSSPLLQSSGSFLTVAKTPEPKYNLDTVSGSSVVSDARKKPAYEMNIKVVLDPNVLERFETETIEYQNLVKETKTDGHIGEWVLVNCSQKEIDTFIELLRYLLRQEQSRSNNDDKKIGGCTIL